MNLSKIVSEGAFGSYGIDDSKKIIPSKLLISKSQRDRIKERNEIATTKHISTKRLNEEESQRSTMSRTNRKEVKSVAKELMGKTKLRNMRQKELAVKLEFMKKLQTKEEENATVLLISRTMLKHNQNTLHEERKKAIHLLSKIETVLKDEIEQQQQQQQPSTTTLPSNSSFSQQIPKKIQSTSISTPSQTNHQIKSQNKPQTNQTNQMNKKSLTPFENQSNHPQISEVKEKKTTSTTPRTPTMAPSLSDSNSNHMKFQFLVDNSNSQSHKKPFELKPSISSLPINQTNITNITKTNTIHKTNSKVGNNVPFSKQSSLQETSDTNLVDEDEDDKEEEDIVSVEEIEVIETNQIQSSVSPSVHVINYSSPSKLSITSKIWGMSGGDKPDVSDGEWDN